jgi:hypothetical protein
MSDIVPAKPTQLAQTAEIPTLLREIRPHWQTKALIRRVRQILPIDPSSACQRLFNASIHDLREKVVVAGIDIARDAARLHKLPPVERPEDIEEYSTAKLIDLAYRMGLLGRADWRRISRCYEIRRDLEHEDDEYEAGIEDCIYIFKSCIDAILSKDPIHVLRVTEVKELIEIPESAAPAPSLVEDYRRAPQARQEEILKFLCSIALDDTKPDLVRQNAFAFLSQLGELSGNQARLAIAGFLQDKIGRATPSRALVRVAYAAGVLPYINRNHLRDYFRKILEKMNEIGHKWTKHAEHGEMLRLFRETGGLQFCPDEECKEIMVWLVLSYVGEEGGPTRYGHVRHVFHSDTAEPLIVELFREAKTRIKPLVIDVLASRRISKAAHTKHLQRRVEELRDLLEDEDENAGATEKSTTH